MHQVNRDFALFRLLPIDRQQKARQKFFLLGAGMTVLPKKPFLLLWNIHEQRFENSFIDDVLLAAIGLQLISAD